MLKWARPIPGGAGTSSAGVWQDESSRHTGRRGGGGGGRGGQRWEGERGREMEGSLSPSLLSASAGEREERERGGEEGGCGGSEGAGGPAVGLTLLGEVEEGIRVKRRGGRGGSGGGSEEQTTNHGRGEECGEKGWRSGEGRREWDHTPSQLGLQSPLLLLLLP